MRTPVFQVQAQVQAQVDRNITEKKMTQGVGTLFFVLPLVPRGVLLLMREHTVFTSSKRRGR